jgi:AcrR family transcriptional regulator
MPPNEREDPTKERILDTAEVLFAQRGYQAVSIREITACADCNLAAVNYHFGNKQNLYVEVFRCRWVPRAKRVQESFKESLAGQNNFSATAIVRSLARAFLEGPLSDEERLRHSQLMTREMAQPTEAFNHVAERAMGPFFKELADNLRSVLPQGLEEERLLLNIFSMFGMILYFNFARVAVSRITGREYDPAFKALLVDHITQFSLEGLGLGIQEGLK